MSQNKYGQEVERQAYCECGDWQSWHLNGIGKCNPCSLSSFSWKACQQFTLLGYGLPIYMIEPTFAAAGRTSDEGGA